MNREHSLSYRLNSLLLVIALAVAASGCVNKAQQNFERPPAPVTVTAAVSQDVANYLDALGKIVARETVSIRSMPVLCECKGAGLRLPRSASVRTCSTAVR